MITKEALEKYFTRRKADLETCQSAYAEQKWEVIENIGHKIKGNGLTFGYPELADIGRDLEKAAADKNPASIQGSLLLLQKWVEAKPASSVSPSINP